jgi:uracil-DNA glycosylase family 4
MGFMPPDAAKPKTQRKPRDPFHGIDPAALMAAGCVGCPLEMSPKAGPSGAMPCDVYMLGEAPGAVEAAEGRPFVGKSGQMLRSMIPPAWKPSVRFNNVVQSWPPKIGKQTAPSPLAMMHCRGYLIDDIEAAQPKAIFGFGNTPLLALTGQTGITRFAGRKMPIQIGKHVCWYFAFVHPASILHAYERDQDALKASLRHQIEVAFSRVDKLPPPTIEGADDALAGVRTLNKAGQVIDWLTLATDACERVGFDYETTGLSPFAPGARLLSAGLAIGQEAIAFPLDHREATWSESERSAILGALQRFLEAPVVKVAHNASFEMLWTLHFFGKRAVRPALWADSLAQAFLLDSRPRAHSLDHLCLVNYGLPLKNVSALDVTNLDNEPLDQVLTYNAMDAKYCLRLWEKQEASIRKQGLLPAYRHHMARVAALVHMQHRGLPFDSAVNAELTAQYRGKLDRIERKLAKLPAVQEFEADGTKFNVASPKQVATLLGIDTTHKFTTDEPMLLGIGSTAAKLVLEWRGIAKVLGTYLTPFGPTAKKPLVYDGMLHPVIGTTGTRTWRTNSNEPNIQNFPTRDTDAKVVRSQIVARPGTVMVCVDYSGIQARNVAMESKDPALVQAFLDHYDIHGDWSERIQRRVPSWAKKRDAKELRSVAKNRLVFPLFFGSQPASIAGYLGVDIEHGYKLYEEFWSEFPDVKLWQDRLHQFYAKHHFVTGLSKFRRRAPITENQIVNSPIQADEALLVCEAMVRLSQYEDEDLQPVMLVHDDLGFFIREERFDECVEIILHEMLRMEHLWLNVPLAVEVSTGYDWCNLSKVGHFESTGDGGFVQIA